MCIFPVHAFSLKQKYDNKLFTIKTFAQFRPALIALILSVAFQSLYGQTAPLAIPPMQKMTGPSAVQPNSTHTYYFDNGSLPMDPNRYNNGGTLSCIVPKKNYS